MKIAYLVLGPEFSGARTITKVLIAAGCYGDYDHRQRLDDLNFNDLPSKIVLRRSLPHGGIWPNLLDIYNKLRAANYGIVAIVALRDKVTSIIVQLEAKNDKTDEESKVISDRIDKAIEVAFSDLASIGLNPVVVLYEPFITYPQFRCNLLRSLGLPDPAIVMYDGNATLKHELTRLDV